MVVAPAVEINQSVVNPDNKSSLNFIVIALIIDEPVRKVVLIDKFRIMSDFYLKILSDLKGFRLNLF